jgi:hypothetical protein
MIFVHVHPIRRSRKAGRHAQAERARQELPEQPEHINLVVVPAGWEAQ